MSITQEAPGLFRGTARRISGLRERLARTPDPSGLAAVLRESSITGETSPDDQILENIRAALATPVFTVEVSNAGPGGLHRHTITAGANAVCVRMSTAGEDFADLAGSPFPLLPGELTRLVKFRPGQPPPPAAAETQLPTELIADLADEDRPTRVAAWAQVRPRLAEALELDPQDESWQLVESRTDWTGTDGRPVDNLGVYLRAGQHYALPVQDSAETVRLLPVPSVQAWQQLIHVLPGMDEVQRPGS